MSPRTRRLTVRAYNLRPGDVPVAGEGTLVESAISYGGYDPFVDVMYRDYDGSSYVHTYSPDSLVTVTRTYN